MNTNYSLVNVKQIKLFAETNTDLIRENFGSVEVADVFKTRLHIPFGRKEAYAKEVTEASLERLSHLIKVCNFLLQTKVYLFWEKNTGVLPQSKSHGVTLVHKSKTRLEDLF
jgi:hypothetical protein